MMKENPRSTRMTGDFFISEVTDLENQLSHEWGAASQLLIELALQGLDNQETLYQAIEHHLRAGGKRIRLLTSLDAGLRLRLEPSERRSLACACELLHNASLVHDDIQDQDHKRRGASSVWAKYGTDIALLAGDHLLVSAFGAIASSKCSPLLLSHFQKRTHHLIAGQSKDLSFSHGREDDNPMKLYKTIASAKSGTLLSLPLELPLIASGHSNAVHQAWRAGQSFAIAYQIADDLEDVKEDARSGNLNLIHLLAEHGVSDAVGDARAEGEQYCLTAKALLDDLPCGIGGFLSGQLEDIHKKIIGGD